MTQAVLGNGTPGLLWIDGSLRYTIPQVTLRGSHDVSTP